MNQKTQERTSLDQHKLTLMGEMLYERLEDILEEFGITNIKKIGKYWVGPCPIHCGDNKGAVNIYGEGSDVVGYWCCNTHHCERKFKKTMIGFIRGLLSNRRHNWSESGIKVNFKETIDWCQGFLGNINLETSSMDADKRNFVMSMSSLNKQTQTSSIGISEQDIKTRLVFPSSYFQSRGYREDILRKYLVGDCNSYGKEMNGRAIVPIIHCGNIVGVSGRSIYNKCNKCQSYHPPNNRCPEENLRHIYSKWKNNKGFKAENYLYNLDNAKQHINEKYSVVIVESPGNVWKLLENNVLNCVASLGTRLTENQLSEISKTKANMVNIIFDNDENGAGQETAKNIAKSLSKLYNVHIITPSKNDISCFTNEEIKQEIIPQIKEWRI